jgi:hypothetical protein
MAARTDVLTFPKQYASKDAAEKGSSAAVVEQTPKAAKQFAYKDATGKTSTAPIVEQFLKSRIVYPIAKIDRRLDPKLSRAATIADERAHARSKSRCWRYVKQALVAAGVVDSYPKTALAKQAGDELVRDYGFKKLSIRDPYAAPVGAVLVYYKGKRRPGHVEMRTKDGFVSDFKTKDACRYPLLGAYVKI